MMAAAKSAMSDMRLGGGPPIGRATGLQRWLVPAFVLFAALLPMAITSERWMRVLVLILVYIVLASGLNLLVGYAGLLDLGYIAFFAIGSYFSSIVTVKLAIGVFGMAPSSVWWLFFVDLGLAGLFTAMIGVLLGYPTLRARGDYLAIMTLAFGEVVRLVSLNWTGLTNGPLGIRDVPTVQLGGFRLLDPFYLYYVAFAIGGIALFCIYRLVASHVGRAWVAIREDQLVAECMGVNTHRYKLLAYASGAFFAGVIGVFYAHTQQFINPDSFQLEDNLLVLSLVILGGAGTLWGPLVGATIWILFQEWAGETTLISENPNLRLVALGLLILVVIRFMPRGIVHRRPWLGFGSSSHPGAGGGDGAGGAIAEDRGGSATVGASPPGPDASPTAAEQGPLMRAEGLSCVFGGVKALTGVDLEVRPNEVLGVIGPNGAGKSTLFNALSGVVPRSGGTVKIGAHEVGRETPSEIRGRGLSRTFQNIRLMPEMTVMENLLVAAHREVRANPFAVTLRTGRVRRAEAAAHAEAERMLELVGLAGHEADQALGLSYGDQRRVEIARALMGGPEVLLLDEPCAGMNPAETAALGELIRSIRDRGIAVVLIEHDMSLMMQIADRIVVLDHGVKIAEGSPKEIREDPRVLDAYLGTAA